MTKSKCKLAQDASQVSSRLFPSIAVVLKHHCYWLDGVISGLTSAWSPPPQMTPGQCSARSRLALPLPRSALQRTRSLMMTASPAQRCQAILDMPTVPCADAAESRAVQHSNMPLEAYRFCELPGPEVCRRHISDQAFEFVLLDSVIAVDVRSCKRVHQPQDGVSTHGSDSVRAQRCVRSATMLSLRVLARVPSMKSCACSSVIWTFLDRNAAVTSFASSLRRVEQRVCVCC